MFGIVGGALADTLDGRRLLIAVQRGLVVAGSAARGPHHRWSYDTGAVAHVYGRRDLHLLEITDAHPKAIRPKVLSQFWPSQDRSRWRERVPRGEKTLRRLAGPGTDLQGPRLRRQRLEECVEELAWIGGPHLVVGLSDFVEGEAYVLWPAHDAIMPQRRRPDMSLEGRQNRRSA